jgi:hypothetical protein
MNLDKFRIRWGLTSPVGAIDDDQKDVEALIIEIERLRTLLDKIHEIDERYARDK